MTFKSKLLLTAVAIFFLVSIIIAKSSTKSELQTSDTNTTTSVELTTPQTPTEKANTYLKEQGKTCLSADESWDYIGANNVCVRFIVRSIYRGSSSTVFLNSEVEGGDFSVVSFYSDPITYADAEGYLGSSISVRGNITEYENQPQIILENKSDIYDVVTAQEREENQREFLERVQSEEYANKAEEIYEQLQERWTQLRLR